MTAGADAALLWWIPVGAGRGASARIVARTSAWWEAADAALRGRPRQTLVHAALELTIDGIPHTVEMTPAWGQPRGARGVVATGAVGSPLLGATRLFRYEVRCWRDGVIPDLAWAAGDAVRLPAASASAVRDALPLVPRLVWGRTPPAPRRRHVELQLPRRVGAGSRRRGRRLARAAARHARARLDRRSRHRRPLWVRCGRDPVHNSGDPGPGGPG